jgi:hypothetical protein
MVITREYMQQTGFLLQILVKHAPETIPGSRFHKQGCKGREKWEFLKIPWTVTPGYCSATKKLGRLKNSH